MARAARTAHTLADPSLAPEGRDRIAWADGQMPVLRSIRSRFEDERPLDGVVVAASLHVTAETACLVLALTAGGARVALCAANPLATQDDVAAALVADHGVEVHAVRGESPAAIERNVGAVLDREPRITLDDGADLLMALHAERPALVPRLLGGTEETRTGLLRLRSLQAAGRLGCAVLAVNEAQTERVFNDRYGTGQSTVDGIMRATNLLLAGRTVVVLGYGATGRGIAARARGAGASVIVCEVDPLAALEARMDGFEAMPSLEAAARGDVFITATGGLRALGAEHFARMKDGAVLANAGHFDVEIDVEALRAAAGGGHREVRPLVEQYDLGDRRLNLLARGQVVNLAAAEGHPAAVMDMSFANHALACEYLARHEGELEPGVHAFPPELDRETARLKLRSLGVEIDELTAEQAAYLSNWGG